MGDHTYKRVAAGHYLSPSGIEISNPGGQWHVYLAARRGFELIGCRDTLREAKVLAEIRLRNEVEAAHAEALSEYFDREVETVAAARKAELDRIGAAADRRDKSLDAEGKYATLQRELTQGVMTAQDKGGGLLRIEVSAEVAALLSGPFGAKPRWSGLRFGGHDVVPRLELAPEAWRITPLAGYPVLAVNPSASSPRAVLRSVLAAIDAHETASGMPLDYPAAVAAVREVATDLGVDL